MAMTNRKRSRHTAFGKKQKRSKEMKKTIYLITLCLIIIFTFTACNKNSANTLDSSNTTVSYTTTDASSITTTTLTIPTTVIENTTFFEVTTLPTETTKTRPLSTTDVSQHSNTSTESKTINETISETVSHTTTEAAHHTQPKVVKTTPTFEGPTANELYTLELLNNEREKLGFPPLTFNYRLYNCAKLRATETKELLSHTRPNGEKFSTVLYDYGLSHNKCLGENIAYNYSNVESAVIALMDSPSHRKNILSEKYNSVSIGIEDLENGRFTMIQLFEG